MDAIEKENLRLTRRLRRLESNMEQLEEMRETNARLMDQLLADLAAERQRSEALLLNVLPQRIVDRPARRRSPTDTRTWPSCSVTSWASRTMPRGRRRRAWWGT
jgi:hypothetical protein